MRKATVFLDDLVFAEGPRWRDGRLWFSDMHAREVLTVDMRGNLETVVSMQDRPSGLGFLPDGRLVIVSMDDRKLLRLDPKGLTLHADLSGIAPSRCNDMVMDSQGRAYVGNFGFDTWSGQEPRDTNLALAMPDGEVRTVAEDVSFPNGSVITPDKKTLILGESRGLRLTAFDIEPDGSLSGRRVWAQLGVPPDGICLDEEGCIWVAIPSRPGGFIRVAEGGEIKERIDPPEDRVGYACMLGGDKGKTLFMLEGFDSNPNKISRGNSRITIVEVDAGRAGLP